METRRGSVRQVSKTREFILENISSLVFTNFLSLFFSWHGMLTVQPGRKNLCFGIGAREKASS